MIHSIGDSHALFTFADILEVKRHTIGPVTMKRVGYLEDNLLSDAVAALGLTAADALILCFGEVDCRCYLHPQVVHRLIGLGGLVQQYVDCYAARVATLPTNGARIAILGIPPATTTERAYNVVMAPAGDNGYRVLYVRTMNAELAQACRSHGWIFLDLARYADAHTGLMLENFSDGGVHIKDPDGVREIMINAGLLKRPVQA